MLNQDNKPPSTTPTPASANRRIKLIKNLTTWLITFCLIGLGLASLLLLGSGEIKPANLILLAICLVSGIVFGFCRWLVTSRQRVELAATILVGAILLAVTLTQFTQFDSSRRGPFIAAFILVPLLAGITGLSRYNTTICAILAVLLMVLTAAGNWSLGRVRPDEEYVLTMFNWLIILALSSIGIIEFTSRLDRAALVAEEQNEQLGKLISALDSTNELGTNLSRELTGVTTELNITSRQQASSTQEQVASVNQVVSSMEELSETANMIAVSAAGAAASATQTLKLSSAVRDMGRAARISAEEGEQAVVLTIDSVERVRNRIELLGHRLLALTEGARRAGTIIELIDEIASETHLLALNASIEAAGATTHVGETSTASSRGERFGVIAQEVKSLSDRSREATEEVRQAISEMQGAVAGAVLVAEEGKKETAAALDRARLAGSVIRSLNEVITDNEQRAEEILDAVEKVDLRCEEIRLATGQQKSANQQILSTMRSITTVAQESASAVTQLSETAGKVNKQLEQLNVVLATSNVTVTRAMSLAGVR